MPELPMERNDGIPPPGRPLSTMPKSSSSDRRCTSRRVAMSGARSLPCPSKPCHEAQLELKTRCPSSVAAVLVPLGEGVGFEPGGSCDWAVDSMAAHKRSATTPLDQLSLQKSFSHNEMSPQFFLKSQSADSVAYFCFT